jgi:hypothetical protein
MCRLLIPRSRRFILAYMFQLGAQSSASQPSSYAVTILFSDVCVGGCSSMTGTVTYTPTCEHIFHNFVTLLGAMSHNYNAETRRRIRQLTPPPLLTLQVKHHRFHLARRTQR